MEPRQTPTDEPAATRASPRSDLLQLVRSLRAHVDELESSGAWGAPPSPASSRAAEGPRPGSTTRARAAAPSAPSSAAASGGESVIESTQVEPGERVPAERVAPAMSGSASAVIHLPLAATARLDELANEARACTRCGLHEGRKKSVFSRGSARSGLVFIGEGPGEEEDLQGLPFVGPAGQLLDRMIIAMQLSRDDVYVCNIVKCRPPKNRKPEPDEMARCMPFLDEQLSILQPRVIVALGATAVQGLLGTTEGITRLRGQWKLYRGNIPVMPTFHPAYLLRTPQAKRDVWKDLQEVLRHMNQPAPPG